MLRSQCYIALGHLRPGMPTGARDQSSTARPFSCVGRLRLVQQSDDGCCDRGGTEHYWYGEAYRRICQGAGTGVEGHTVDQSVRGAQPAVYSKKLHGAVMRLDLQFYLTEDA